MSFRNRRSTPAIVALAGVVAVPLLVSLLVLVRSKPSLVPLDERLMRPVPGTPPPEVEALTPVATATESSRHGRRDPVATSLVASSRPSTSTLPTDSRDAGWTAPSELPDEPEPRAALQPMDAAVAVTATPEDLHDRWVQETFNQEWSENTWTFVAAILEGTGADSEQLESVDCRETLCKVELKSGDARALYTVGRDFKAQNVPFQVRFTNVDGGPRTVAYLSREGMESEVFTTAGGGEQETASE